jgi:hypothetical protein
MICLNIGPVIWRLWLGDAGTYCGFMPLVYEYDRGYLDIMQEQDIRGQAVLSVWHIGHKHPQSDLYHCIAYPLRLL